MNHLLYKRKQGTSPSKINWPNLVLYAEAAGEAFEELNITTLKAHYDSLCQEMAVGIVTYCGDEEKWFNDIRIHAEAIMDSGNVQVCEFVRMDDDSNATVVIDVDVITDAEVNVALARLEQTVFSGVTEFSEPKTFTAQQIREIQINANTSR